MAVSEWCSQKTGWLRMGPRRNSEAGRAAPRSSAPPPCATPKASSTAGHVPGGGRLAARDADVVRIDQTEQDAPCAGFGDDRGGPPRCPHDHRVEELPVEEVETRPPQAVGQLDRPAVDPPGDAPQSLRAVVHRVHGGNDRQEDLRRADVRRRLLPADVLLARLERQPVGGPPLRVDRQPDQASRQVPLEACLHRHERCVRPSVPERDAETLRGPDHHVGPPLPRRLEEGERQEVGGHGHQRAAGVGLLGQRGEVPDGARATRVLLHHAEELADGQAVVEIGHGDLDPEWLEARLQHGQRLREAVGVDEDPVGLDPGAPAHERDRLGHRGALVEQRGVGRLEPAEIRHHCLEVQQGLQAALTDLGLVRGVGGVPGRTLEDVASDHTGRDRAVVAEADHGFGDPVARGELAQLIEHRVLRDGRRQVECVEAADAGRHRRVDQRIERLVTQDLEHGHLLLVRRPDVPAHEVLEGLE